MSASRWSLASSWVTVGIQFAYRFLGLPGVGRLTIWISSLKETGDLGTGLIVQSFLGHAEESRGAIEGVPSPVSVAKNVLLHPPPLLI
jgi:hypothetical protein